MDGFHRLKTCHWLLRILPRSTLQSASVIVVLSIHCYLGVLERVFQVDSVEWHWHVLNFDSFSVGIGVAPHIGRRIAVIVPNVYCSQCGSLFMKDLELA